MMILKQFSNLPSITNIHPRLPLYVSQYIMPTLPVFFDRMSYRLLHHKPHLDVSRRTRGRKHSVGILSKMSNPRYFKSPNMTKSSLVSLKIPLPESPALFALNQFRPLSNNHQFVTDEADFDSILHEREFEMHRHNRSPLSRIVKYAKGAVNGKHTTTEHDLKVLDIASKPIDAAMTIANDLGKVSLYALSSSRDMLRVFSNKLEEENRPNVTTELSDLINLSEFADNSLDLVISCYGLQSSSDPDKLMKEIHRVLKPGGTMVTAIWERLGTEPIVDKILEKVFSMKLNCMERKHLTKPHELERVIENAGLKILNIDHGEYPLYLSSADGLHGSAFDIISLPIKTALVELMHSGERPYAFEDARAEFDHIVEQGNLVTTDSQGRLVVEDNRYKIVVARRQYEDSDREKDIELKKESTKKMPKLGIKQPDVKSVKNMMEAFNSLLIDTLKEVPNSPWKQMIDSVKQDIAVSGHDVSQKVNLLDLASYPNEGTKLMASAFPDVNIYSTDLSLEDMKDMKTYSSKNHLNHVSSSMISERQLKDFNDCSMDIITCSFGLTRFSDPASMLKEVHRVLKPGGSFITTTWDSISLERIGDSILSEILLEKEPHIDTPILNLSSYSAPRKVERLIESTGTLDVIKVDHQEFPFYLGSDDASLSSESNAFSNSIIPIRHLLKTLEETGVNPNAFDDARRVYQKMLNENQLLWKDDQGKVRTVRNRYKLLIARRKFEDSNGILDRSEMDKYNRNHDNAK